VIDNYRDVHAQIQYSRLPEGFEYTVLASLTVHMVGASDGNVYMVWEGDPHCLPTVQRGATLGNNPLDMESMAVRLPGVLFSSEIRTFYPYRFACRAFGCDLWLQAFYDEIGRTWYVFKKPALPEMRFHDDSLSRQRRKRDVKS
jgi:hypothetical protein